ncbi:MAG: efflux RND transporter periplasmic adaptor subunit [Verrucomicrobiales bacterium]
MSFHFMKSRESSDDLAAIVARGASRPARKWLILTVATALIGMGVWYFLSRGKEADLKDDYETQEAKNGRISLIVTAAGNLAPTNQIVVGSELSGTAKEVLVDTNDQVKQGQTLARLDTSKLDQQTERSRAALLSAKARVSQAEATLAESRAALARQEELHKLSGGKTPSRAAMETARATGSRAEADLESAKATVAGGEAEVRAFESDLEKTIIRSPVDGIVLARSIEVGQTVAASFTAPTLFTIAEDLKKMELLVNVSEADIGRIEAGQTATFSVDAWPNRNYTAKVKKVAFGAVGTGTTASGSSSGSGSSSANSVVSYSTELEVANEDLSLRPGMTATVDIAIVDKSDILIVPNSALRFDPVAAKAIGKPDATKRTLVQSLSPGGGRRWRGAPPPKAGSSDSPPRVWTLKNGEPSEILVTMGITDGRFTEIVGGDLTAGTPLIISIKPPRTE